MANDFCEYLHMSAFVSCPDKWQNPLKSGECAWQTEPETQQKKNTAYAMDGSKYAAGSVA